MELLTPTREEPTKWYRMGTFMVLILASYFFIYRNGTAT